MGFFFRHHENGEDLGGLLIGDTNGVIMLFVEQTFEGLVDHSVADTSKGSEMLISFEVKSREEVDQIAANVKNAGGTIFARPSEDYGWLYSCGFIDLDGHRWNVRYRDKDKLPISTVDFIADQGAF